MPNSIKIKQFEWALEFIEQNTHIIYGENVTQDFFRFNMANYLFGVGRFDECLDYIPATSPFMDYFLFGKR